MKNCLKILVIVLFISCENDKKDSSGLVEVNQTTIAKHIERLASDEFLGRKPFTEGEVKTVNLRLPENIIFYNVNKTYKLS